MRYRLIAAVVAFIWVGMILAIGMESIVKFYTPTLVKAIGFDEGRTVFSAFFRVEAVLMLILIITGVFGDFRKFEQMLIVGTAIALIIQVFWLFPQLSAQVDMVLSGVSPPHTYQHSLFGVLELCKLIMLFALGIEILRGNPR